MSDFHEKILVETVGLDLYEIRETVIMQEVLCNTCSLCLPVTPDTHPAVMDMISAEDDIDSGMELDTCDLRSAELLHAVNVMDVVVFDDRKYASHSSYDTGLFAVMDMASSYDMSADGLLGPAVILSTAYGIPLHLGGTLYMLVEEVIVVVFLGIVTEGNTAALRSVDIAVFDDPAL